MIKIFVESMAKKLTTTFLTTEGHGGHRVPMAIGIHRKHREKISENWCNFSLAK